MLFGWLWTDVTETFADVVDHFWYLFLLKVLFIEVFLFDFLIVVTLTIVSEVVEYHLLVLYGFLRRNLFRIGI